MALKVEWEFSIITALDRMRAGDILVNEDHYYRMKRTANSFVFQIFVSSGECAETNCWEQNFWKNTAELPTQGWRAYHMEDSTKWLIKRPNLLTKEGLAYSERFQRLN